MLKYNEQLIMALDIGASKTVCAVGEVSQTGRVTLWGWHEEPSLGWRKGNINDIELAAASLRNIVETVQSAIGSLSYVVRVGFSSPALNITRHKSEGHFGDAGHRMTGEDINEVLKMLKNTANRENYKILHVIPVAFYIDNQSVKEPLNKIGKCLAIEAMVIAVVSDTIDNLLMLLNLAGIKVKEVILSCLASVDVVLNATEKEFGTVYVDIGGQTTGIAVYSRGYLIDMVVLPGGSDYITGDLAVGLGISLANAERIKLALGVVPGVMIAEEIEVESLKGTEMKQVSCRLAVDIIEARVNEILAMIKENVETISSKGLMLTGMVMSGGGSLLSGLVPLAEKRLDMSVRMTAPEVYIKSGVKIDGISWGVVGLIKFRDCTKFEKPLLHRQKPCKLHKLLTSVGLLNKLKLWSGSFLELIGIIGSGRVTVLKRFYTFWVKK